MHEKRVWGNLTDQDDAARIQAAEMDTGGVVRHDIKSRFFASDITSSRSSFSLSFQRPFQQPQFAQHLAAQSACPEIAHIPRLTAVLEPSGHETGKGSLAARAQAAAAFNQRESIVPTKGGGVGIDSHRGVQTGHNVDAHFKMKTVAGDRKYT